MPAFPESASEPTIRLDDLDFLVWIRDSNEAK
jgi:hypothetical protein